MLWQTVVYTQKPFTLKLKIWSEHCSCKIVDQLQDSERISRACLREISYWNSVVLLSSGGLQDAIHARRIKLQVYMSWILLLESSAPVFHLFFVRLFQLNQYSFIPNLAYVVCSKQVLFKWFYWTFVMWGTCYCTLQQFTENDCFTLNSS